MLYYNYKKEGVFQMTNIQLALFSVSFIIVILLIIYIATKFSNAIYNKREEKREKQYPELYRLIELHNEKQHEICNWYNSQIAPLKKQVDIILKNMDYFPKDIRIKKEKELEDLRIKIYTAQMAYQSLDKQVKENRNKIKEYIKKNNIKWAKDAWNVD